MKSPIRPIVVCVATMGAVAGTCSAGDRDLLLATPGGAGVSRFDMPTGVPMGTFLSDLPGANYIATGPDGNLYVSDLSLDAVVKYDGRTGKSLGVFVTSGSGALDAPHGLAFGPDGHLYVASTYPPRINRYDGVTGTFMNTVVDRGFLVPGGLAFHPNGDMYLVCTPCQKVHRFLAPEYTTDQFVVTFENIKHPYGITFGPDGDLYVTSTDDDDCVKRFSAEGAPKGIFATGLLDEPFGVTFGPDGDLYVSARLSANVVRYEGETGALVGQLASVDSPAHDIVFTIDFCTADFDGDGFVSGIDFDLYVAAFEAGESTSDFDGDGFTTGIDFDMYVQAFEAGC